MMNPCKPAATRELPGTWLTVVLVIAAAGGGIVAQELRVARTPPPAPMPPAQTRAGLLPLPPVIVKPALVATTDLSGFADLPAGRRKLIETALAVARDSPWLPYLHGGADPALGGLDCSGAMYFVMRQCGLTPPRTSSGQYLWLHDHHLLHRVAEDASTADDPSLAGLLPGDLLFWGTGPKAGAAENAHITHVAMYLGREAKDGLQVIINATDGRSYRGTKANGYGVYDFRVPTEEGKAKVVGYGPPPGMTAIKPPAAPPP